MTPSRAEKAGVSLGLSIVETVHLLYQRNTAKNFLRGVTGVLRRELKRREDEIEIPKGKRGKTRVIPIGIA